MFRSKDIVKLIPVEALTLDNFILEIGANNGSDTCQFNDHVRYYNIVAFEPDNRAFNKLKNIFQKHNAIKLINKAVSNIDGVTKFFPSTSSISGQEEWDMSGSLLAPKLHLQRHPWVSFKNPIEVETVRIDSVLNTFPKVSEISFVWMDVQGAEKSVLESFGNYLDKVKYIYTEYGNEELYEGQELKNSIRDILKNFDVIDDDGDNFLLKHKGI
jgi:FkbM family methyltransferase